MSMRVRVALSERLVGLMAASLALAAAVSPAQATADIGFTSLPSASAQEKLTTELGAAISAPILAPAEPLGMARVEAGLSSTATAISSDASFWNAASQNGTFSSYVVLPRAWARVGLPWGVDVSGSYAKLPGSNVESFGGAVKWAFISGSVAVPAFAVRLAHDRLRGVDQMSLKATSVDLSISKGILFFTPYAGVGRYWFSSNVHDVPGTSGSVSASPAENMIYAGARFSMGWFKTVAEVQKTGPVHSYSLKLALAFP